MKHKLTKRVVLVLVACVACVLAFGATLAKADEDAGSTGDNKLVVTLANNDPELNDLTAKVNLYCIATGSKDTRYDTYNYNFNDTDNNVTAFSTLGEGYDAALANAPEMSSSDWNSYWKTYWEKTAAAAEEIVQNNSSLKPMTFVSGETINTLPNGIYLVLIQSVNSKHNAYSFAPQLVALPGKVGADASPVYNTSQGSWTNATDPVTVVELVAKPSMAPLYGSITIKKDVNNPTGDPATFTFHITNKDDNGTYDNYAAVMLSPDNEWSTTINNIPAGYTYTVTEVDSGAQYQPVDQRDRTTVEVKAGQTTEVQSNEVTFTNEPNGSIKQGYGIENHFEFRNGQWQEPEQRTINNNANE